MLGVSQGPVSSSVMVVRSQPPRNMSLAVLVLMYCRPLPKRQLIHPREQHAVTASTGNIAEVLFDMKPIGDGKSVIDLAGERARRITLIVCHTLSVGVVCIHVEPMLQTMRRLDLECVIVCLTCIERTEERRPILMWRAGIHKAPAVAPVLYGVVLAGIWLRSSVMLSR